ncbi:unnamed protein product, partial [Didymodactylos carnosus]
IWPNTFVTKILIDEREKSACGVEYVSHSHLYGASPLSNHADRKYLKRQFIHAKKEVIISGGQFNTPQLLQLSGIGDENKLAEHDIKTVQHLQGVGKNMQDRQEIPHILKMKQEVLIENGCTLGLTPDDPCLIKYYQTGNSLYSRDGIVLGLLHSTYPKLSVPDSLILLVPNRFIGFRQGWFDPQTPPIYITASILKAHSPNTLGSVEIQSNDPFDMPLIQLNRFADNSDELDRVVQDLQFSRKLLLNSKYNFSNYVLDEELPGSNITTDEDLKSYIRQNVWGHHACCTAKMGKKNDKMAVLDSKGQVYNIANLRVVDISIFPKDMGYFPTLSIYIAAEKLADEIANKYDNKRSLVCNVEKHNAFKLRFLFRILVMFET